jgi:uncharacterized protein YbjT (DUF2867 family)
MNPKAQDAPADHSKMIAAITGALEQVKPQHIVVISDYGAHHTAGTGVTLTFHRLEQRLRSNSILCTVLRSAEHMQNWSRFIHIVRETGVLPTFYHPATRLFPIVSAPDVGLIAADLLASPHSEKESGRVVHVEGPRRYSVQDLLKNIGAAVGRPVEARELKPRDWVSALMQGGLSESYARLVSEMYEAHNSGRIEVEPGSGEVRKGSTSLAQAFAIIAAHTPN